jgi:hypothetical protein
MTTLEQARENAAQAHRFDLLLAAIPNPVPDLSALGDHANVAAQSLFAAYVALETNATFVAEANTNIAALSAARSTSQITGTLYVSNGYNQATVLAAVEAAITSYAGSVAAGGVVYASKVWAAVMGVAGVYDWKPTSLTYGSFTLAPATTWSPTFNITTSA